MSLAVLMPVVDLNSSHLLHPDWSTHARLHMLWTVLVFCMLGWYSLYLLWLRPWAMTTRLHIVMAIHFIITSAFLVSAVLKPFYGGGLADLNGGVPPLPNGSDPNLTMVSLVLILLLICSWLLREKKYHEAI